MKKSLICILTIIASIMLESCKKDGTNGRWIMVELKATKSMQTLPINKGRFSVSVYGADPNYQDVPASLIAKQEFSTLKLPYTIKIDIPKDAYKKIQYLNDKKYAQYYLDIEWDSNGSGKRCDGDFLIDFDNKFPTVILNKYNKQVIYLKPCM